MEREKLYGNEQSYDRKPITAFHALSQMAPNTVIEGYFKGRFESKKKPGAFFIIVEDETTGEAHAYGTCKVLDERVEQFKEKARELGMEPEKLILSTTFLGRLPNKNNSRTSYKFTNIVIYRPKAPGVSVQMMPQGTNVAVNTADIPF